MVPDLLILVALAAVAAVVMAIVASTRRNRRNDRRVTRSILLDHDITAMRARQAKLAERLPPPRTSTSTSLPLGVGGSGQRAARELLEHRGD